MFQQNFYPLGPGPVHNSLSGTFTYPDRSGYPAESYMHASTSASASHALIVNNGLDGNVLAHRDEFSASATSSIHWGAMFGEFTTSVRTASQSKWSFTQPVRYRMTYDLSGSDSAAYMETRLEDGVRAIAEISWPGAGQLSGRLAAGTYTINTYSNMDLRHANPAPAAASTSAGTVEYEFYTDALMFRELSEGDKDGSWGGLGDDIPGYDHVGLLSGGRVHESHPGYGSGNYWDPEQGKFVPVNRQNGVQSGHTYGTFKHDSGSISVTPVFKFDEVPIPRSLAQGMQDAIATRQDARFGNINPSKWLNNSTLLPQVQKGSNGTFTCVGLVEWAAEQAGHHGGAGFIPDEMEQISVPGLGVLPTLSPELLYHAARIGNLLTDASAFLQGLLDPVDFILTDPGGHRLGFTAATGAFNEIPGAFYSGNGTVEQFLILNPLPGEYRLQLLGIDQDALAGLGTGNSAVGYGGFLGAGEIKELVISVNDVPEPASLFFTLAIVICIRCPRPGSATRSKV